MGEYAPGIPSRGEFGDPARLRPGLAEWVVQQHLAERAGPHYDVRLGTPETGLLSWAARKGLPEPGKRHLAVQQPVHTLPYAEFEGRIPSGYGAGEVKKADRGEVLILDAKPDKVSFAVAHKKFPEYFTLVKPKGFGGDRDWLLINTTPTKIVENKKIRYTKVPAEEVEKMFDERYLASEKIDGASALVRFLDDDIDIISYRASKSGRPIVHTHRLSGTPLKSDVPKEWKKRILKGELYGVRKSTGEAIPPQELGGILNASLAEAIRKMGEQDVDLRVALFDVLGEEDKPYPVRKELLEEALKILPEDKFHLPRMAERPEEMRKLWEEIEAGKSPYTREGLVFHPREGGKPLKVKRTPEAKVVIRDIFPGAGRLEGTGAGGFEYSIEEDGPAVGRVGTGFTEEMRRKMWKNPEEFVGRVARIRAQDQFPRTGAFRAPAFIALHEEYEKLPEEEGEENKKQFPKVAGFWADVAMEALKGGLSGASLGGYLGHQGAYGWRGFEGDPSATGGAVRMGLAGGAAGAVAGGIFNRIREYLRDTELERKMREWEERMEGKKKKNEKTAAKADVGLYRNDVKYPTATGGRPVRASNAVLMGQIGKPERYAGGLPVYNQQDGERTKIAEIIEKVKGKIAQNLYPDAGEDAPPGVQQEIDRFRSMPPEDRDRPLLYYLLGEGTPDYKMSKEDAEYQEEPKGDQKCGNCEFAYKKVVRNQFICSKVEGDIKPEAWCKFWAPNEEKQKTAGEAQKAPSGGKQIDWIVYDYDGNLLCIALDNEGEGWKLTEWVNFEGLSQNKLREMLDMGFMTMLEAAKGRDSYTYIIGNHAFDWADENSSYFKELLGDKFEGKNSVSIDIDLDEFRSQVEKLVAPKDVTFKKEAGEEREPEVDNHSSAPQHKMRPRAELILFTKGGVYAIDKGDYLLFPGGGVDDGEEPRDAAIRETIEESNRHPINVDQSGIVEAVWPEDSGNDFWDDSKFDGERTYFFLGVDSGEAGVTHDDQEKFEVKSFDTIIDRLGELIEDESQQWARRNNEIRRELVTRAKENAQRDEGMKPMKRASSFEDFVVKRAQQYLDKGMLPPPWLYDEVKEGQEYDITQQEEVVGDAQAPAQPAPPPMQQIQQATPEARYQISGAPKDFDEAFADQLRQQVTPQAQPGAQVQPRAQTAPGGGVGAPYKAAQAITHSGAFRQSTPELVTSGGSGDTLQDEREEYGVPESMMTEPGDVGKSTNAPAIGTNIVPPLQNDLEKEASLKERIRRKVAEAVPSPLRSLTVLMQIKAAAMALEEELRVGTKEELEHTSDLDEAEEIAREHLEEDKNYYDKLEDAGLLDATRNKEKKTADVVQLMPRREQILFTPEGKLVARPTGRRRFELPQEGPGRPVPYEERIPFIPPTGIEEPGFHGYDVGLHIGEVPEVPEGFETVDPEEALKQFYGSMGIAENRPYRQLDRARARAILRYLKRKKKEREEERQEPVTDEPMNRPEFSTTEGTFSEAPGAVRDY